MSGETTRDVLTGAIVEVRGTGGHPGQVEIVVDGKVVATVLASELSALQCECQDYDHFQDYIGADDAPTEPAKS